MKARPWMVTTLCRVSALAILTSIGGQGVAAADEPTRIARDAGSPQRSALAGPLEFQPEIEISPIGVTSTPAVVDEGRAAKLPLPPRGAKRLADSSAATELVPRWVAERVGIVLALFVAIVLVHRCWRSPSSQSLTNGMVQVCGKVPLDAKQSLHLVRVGQRLLVLLEAPQGMQCIAEITDPAEVHRLLNSEERSHNEPAALNVRQVLSTFRHRESSLA